MQTFLEWIEHNDVSLQEGIRWNIVKGFLQIISMTIDAADAAIGYAEKIIMAGAAGAAMYGWNFLRSKMHLPPDPMTYLGYGVIAAIYTLRGLESLRSSLQNAIEGLRSVIENGDEKSIEKQKSKIEKLKERLSFAFYRTKKQLGKIKSSNQATYIPVPFN